MKVYGKLKSKHGAIYFGQEQIYVTDDEFQELCNVHIGKYAILDGNGSVINGKTNGVTNETVFPSSFEWYKKELLSAKSVDSEEQEEVEEESSVPDNSWTKANMKEYMDGKNIGYNSGDTKADLLEKIEWHNNQ